MNKKFKSIIRKIPFLMGVLRNVKYFIKHLISARHVNRLLSEQELIYLEIGAGDRRGDNGWITIDMTENCDIYWDLRKGIPFPKGSIKKIYSSHFLEHLSFNEGQRFLDECMRVLVAGGNFSICIPNARLYIEAYLNGQNLDETKFFGHKPAFNNTTKIDYINYMAYMDGHHKYMFDEENIIFLLKSKGLKNVRVRMFDSNLDLKERDFESIYVEAEKY
jgi:predicted SAM-dependent methyltransferase